MMTTAFAVQLIFKLVIGVAGILMARLSLYWFDRYLITEEFKDMVNDWDDQAQATYFAGRFLAVALCIGLALS